MSKATSEYLNLPLRTREEAMSETNVVRYNFADHRAPLDNTRPCDVGDYEVVTFNDPKPAPSCDAQRKNATRQVIAGWVAALVIVAVLVAANFLIGGL